MRRILALVILVVASPAFAEAPGEHGKPAAGAHGSVKYKVHDHDGNTKTVDVGDPKQRQELLQDLDHGHVHELKKDEKLDLFGIKRWDLGLWSILIFVTLFLVLKKFAWGPMLGGLQKREESIRGALEQAEKTRREALELQSQLDAKMRDAGAEIAQKMDEARRDASALKDQMVAEGRSAIQQEKDRARREIDSDREAALVEIRQHAIALAAAMSAKAVRRGLSEEDHRRLLDESLAELAQGNKSRHA